MTYIFLLKSNKSDSDQNMKWSNNLAAQVWMDLLKDNLSQFSLHRCKPAFSHSEIYFGSVKTIISNLRKYATQIIKTRYFLKFDQNTKWRLQGDHTTTLKEI